MWESEDPHGHVSETFISAAGGHTELKAKTKLNCQVADFREGGILSWASLLYQCQGNDKESLRLLRLGQETPL